MALRNRAWGRPKSRTIPTSWGNAHAPALDRMANADVTLWPAGLADAPELDDDFLPGPSSTGTPLWTGRGKVEALSTQRRVQVLGEQAVTIGAYDVEIPRDVAAPPLGTQVSIVADTDPSLTGRTLFVADVELGGARFGRHMVCVDDKTSIPTTEG